MDDAFTNFSSHPVIFILLLFFSIGFIIFFHELGHYLVARFFGVRVDKFSIGFGREIYGFTDKNKMRWSFGWIPLGGYIKIFGDVDPRDPQIWDNTIKAKRRLSDEEIDFSFFNRAIWKRALIVLGGPIANFILSFLIILGVFIFIGEFGSRPYVNAIGVGSAAERAGLQHMDKIVAIDGAPVYTLEDVTELTLENEGRPFSYTIEREGGVKDIQITPELLQYKDKFGIERSHGRVGAVFFQAIKFEYITSINGQDMRDQPDLARKTIIDAMGNFITLGVKHAVDDELVFNVFVYEDPNKYLFEPDHKYYDRVFLYENDDPYYKPLSLMRSFERALWRLGQLFHESYKILEVLVTGQALGQKVGGIGAIAEFAGRSIEGGVYSYFLFISILSLQIGIINLIPLPVLDGGHLLFLSYEAVFRRPLPERVKDYAYLFGVAILFALMIFANLNDILSLWR